MLEDMLFGSSFIDDSNDNDRNYMKLNKYEVEEIEQHVNLFNTSEDEQMIPSFHLLKHERVNNGDLFGALINRRIHSSSKVLKSNSLFSLSVPTIDVDEHCDIVQHVIDKENNNQLTNNIIMNNYESHFEDNQELQSINDNRTMYDKTRELGPQLSLTTKNEFANIIYNQFTPFLLPEKELILKSLLALRGISSEIYKLDDEIYIDSNFPVVLVPGYSPTSIRRYLSNFRKGFMLRLLIGCACDAFSSSSDSSQQALGSALNELSFILDSSIMAMENELNCNSSFINLWTSSEPLRFILWNIVCSIAPEDLFLVLHQGKLNFINENDDAFQAHYQLIRKYATINESWIINNSAVSWDLFEKLYEKVKNRRHIVWQQSCQTIFSDLERTQLYYFHNSSDNDPTLTFANFMMVSFLLNRAAVPSLSLLEKLLFKMDNDTDLSHINDIDVILSLRICSDDLWDEYDDIVNYLRNMNMWLRGRLSVIKLYENETQNVVQNGSMSYSLIDMCNDFTSKLLIPMQEVDEIHLAKTILKSKKKQKLLCHFILSKVDEWIMDNNPDQLENITTDLHTQNNVDGYNMPLVTDLHPEDTFIVRNDIIFIEQKKEQVDESKYDQYATSLTPINSIRLVETELLEKAKQDYIQKYEESTILLEKKEKKMQWIKTRMNQIVDSRNLLLDMYNLEYNQWLLQSQILRSLQNGQDLPSDITVSTLSLADHANEDRDADKPSVRVSQNPGGDSTLSLADHANEDRETDKPSVRVSQNPGGDSTLSLADHANEDRDEENTLTGDEATMVTGDDVNSLTDIIQSQPERVEYVHHDVGATSEPDRSDVKKHVDSNHYIAYNILNPDTSTLKNEGNVVGFLSSLLDSLFLLCSSNESLKGDSKSSIDTNSDLFSISKPFLPIVKNTLGLAVKMQSELLDQAALYSTICGAKLLEHIDSFDDTFLLSPKSDFLFSLCATMIENHTERYPFHTSRNIISNRKYEYSKYKIDNLWNEKAIKIAFDRICKSRNINHNGKIYFNRSIKKSNEDDVLNDVLWRNAPWESLFSKVGIESMYIEYIAPFPISAIYSKELCYNFSLVMQKLMELAQISIILKILWNEIRGLRVINSKDTNGKYAHSKLEREMFHSYRVIQQTVHSLYDYAIDRIRCCQISFKKSIRASATSGYGVIYNIMEEYSSNLCSSFFIDYENLEAVADDSSIGTAMELTLDMCRRSLKAIMKVILKAEETNQTPDYVSDLINLRTEMSELNRCSQVLKSKAEEVSLYSEQVNAKMLTQFFVLAGTL